MANGIMNRMHIRWLLAPVALILNPLPTGGKVLGK